MVSDLVRISKERLVFGKGYLPNWTEEIFVVYNRNFAKENGNIENNLVQ